MATEKIQELADEYGIPTEVVEEYIEYMGFDEDEVDSLNYYGSFNNESDFAEQLVDEGVITNLSRYLYMTATDMRILAGEEADNRVDNMDDEEVLDETEDNYSPDEIDEAREYLKSQYYDEIHEELEKDAVGYFVDQFGYSEEELAKQSIFSVDYDKLGETLEYDYTYITHDGGDVYVFSNYARGGMMAKGGMTEHGLKHGDKIIGGKLIGTTIRVRNERLDEDARVDLQTGKRTILNYNSKTKKWEEKMADGGVTFDDKVQSISKSLMKRKKVSPSVQKDYGKTYSKKEAIESAKRIAGAMRKKETSKKK
jgi:hypothetical protein